MAKQSDGTKSKTQIVRELMAKGLTGPKEISEAAKTEFQADIAPGYVSTIKNGLKRKKGKRKAIVRGKRVVTSAAPSAPRSAGGDLFLENLALRFALRAGGIDAAIQALEKLR
jgi:hypothetical protein